VLHIQTHIVDLGPDKDNIITTRLLVPSSEIACFDGREGSLSDIQRQTSANVQILPREDLPSCALESDELIQVCLYPRKRLSCIEWLCIIYLGVSSNGDQFGLMMAADCCFFVNMLEQIGLEAIVFVRQISSLFTRIFFITHAIINFSGMNHYF